MNAKTQDMELEELFKENEKDYITYEKLVKYFSKQPNSVFVGFLSLGIYSFLLSCQICCSITGYCSIL